MFNVNYKIIWIKIECDECVIKFYIDKIVSFARSKSLPCVESHPRILANEEIEWINLEQSLINRNNFQASCFTKLFLKFAMHYN